MIVLCRMATAVADWAHARAAREYARTLLTGPHCCATTSFDHASPTSHRAQRECPATQIARHGCRQHAWVSTCSQGYRYLNTTQHFFPRSPIGREMCPTWATRNATWHESCARAVHSGGSAMASMVMARRACPCPPDSSVAADGRAVRARQGGPSTSWALGARFQK